MAPILRAAGHEVYCPTLTGLGERSHLLGPDIDLDTHITDVVNLLVYEDLSDVILAGHSYGGMVITGVADRALDRVGHLVFLDAAHPETGVAGRRRPARWPARPSSGSSPASSRAPPRGAPGDYGVTDPDDFAWMQPG